jgi:hypothetical protein
VCVTPRPEFYLAKTLYLSRILLKDSPEKEDCLVAQNEKCRIAGSRSKNIEEPQPELEYLLDFSGIREYDDAVRQVV